MKKTYNIPKTSLMLADVEQMLAGSVLSGSNDINIGYGGVDEDGTLTPDAKESNWDVWSD